MTLLAGAATADISPRKPVPLFGYPHATRVSTGIHDPLLASALYLANGDQAAVLISLDLLFVEPPVARRIRFGVARACSVPEACVFIGCTHTHSGPISSRILAWQDDPAAPEPDAGYLEAVAEHAAEAAAAARKRAVPARLAWTSADATGVGGNRRRPDGPTDPECGILAVRHAADDSPWLAVVLIYGMHPTVLHEDSTLVSADFPYAARVHLREHLRADMPVIHFTAPCGDQSPRWFVREQSFREAERLGRMLGAAALAGIRSVDGDAFSAEAVIAGSLRTVSLVRRRLPTIAEARQDVQRCQAEYHRLRSEGADRARVRTAECAVFGAQSAFGLARAQENGQIDALLHAYGAPEIQGVRIGPAVLLGLPGELFAHYSLEIKRRSPARVFPVSLVNGELQGYICTPDAAAAGGYEAVNCIFAPESGASLVDAGVALADELAALLPALYEKR